MILYENTDDWYKLFDEIDHAFLNLVPEHAIPGTTLRWKMKKIT
jgi:hypothetical protein